MIEIIRLCSWPGALKSFANLSMNIRSKLWNRDGSSDWHHNRGAHQ
jgi:hypothetical protein